MPSGTPTLTPCACFLRAGLAGAALLVAACGHQGAGLSGGPGSSTRRGGEAEISTGLNALESGSVQPTPVAAGDEPEEDDRTAELISLMEMAQQNGELSVDGALPGAEEERLAASDGGSVAEANPGVAYSLPAEPELSAPNPEAALDTGFDFAALPDLPEESRDQRRRRLLGDLAAVIREEAGEAPAPGPVLAQIAALRFLQIPRANVSPAPRDAGSSPNGADAPLPQSPRGVAAPPDELDDYLRSMSLSPSERDMLDSWSDFIFQARMGLVQYGELTAVAGPAQDLADALTAWRPLSIEQIKLCTKVEGYGVYSELKQFGGEHKFLAGRPARMIVYVEPGNFQHTSVSREGVWGQEVRLTQDLRLYHAAKDADTLVWRKPDQEITDFSRNRRRDFFIVQVIELPANLSVGAYRLKVILTDKANSAVAETIVPIEIVADASALRD